MDRTRLEAILSGKPVAGLKKSVKVPVLKPTAQMEQCLPALNRLRAAPSTGARRLELTSSQLPPCF
jgi:hypothetical protein